MQRALRAPVRAEAQVGGRAARAVFQRRLQQECWTYLFCVVDAGRADPCFEERDEILLAPHRRAGGVKVLFRQPEHQQTRFRVGSGAPHQTLHGRREGCGVGVGKERKEIHEALLDEAFVAAGQRVAEIHRVPEVFQQVGRAGMGCAQRGRHGGQRKRRRAGHVPGERPARRLCAVRLRQPHGGRLPDGRSCGGVSGRGCRGCGPPEVRCGRQRHNRSLGPKIRAEAEEAPQRGAERQCAQKFHDAVRVRPTCPTPRSARSRRRSVSGGCCLLPRTHCCTGGD